MNSIVSVRNISKSFSSGGQPVKALDSISFNIKKGEVFGLLGPNGAGKTTLISVLCGFLIPDSGKAKMFGMDCTNEGCTIHKRMNFTTGFGGISEFFSCEELLKFYCMLYNLDNTEQRISLSLQATNLEKFRKHRPADFSSGLGRRFLISKALLNDPEVLLLDEPTVGLDVESATNLRDLIHRLKKKGTTILLTTHNLKEAEELCDRIALIRGGKIIATGTVNELKDKCFPYEVLDIRCSKPAKLGHLLNGRAQVVKIEKSEGRIKIFLKSEKDVAAILKLISNADSGIISVNTVEPELKSLYSKLMRSGL